MPSRKRCSLSGCVAAAGARGAAVFDHANRRTVPLRVRADRTQFILGKVAAAHTAPHAARRFLEGRHQFGQPRRFFNEQVKGNALG